MPQEDQPVRNRSVPIAIASVLSITGGAIGLSLCLAAMLFYTEGTLYSTPVLGFLLLHLTGYAIPLGTAAAILFSYQIAVGYLLWQGVKSAKLATTIISIADIGMYLVFVIISPAIVLIALPLLLLGLVLLSTTVAG